MEGLGGQAKSEKNYNPEEKEGQYAFYVHAHSMHACVRVARMRADAALDESFTQTQNNLT